MSGADNLNFEAQYDLKRNEADEEFAYSAHKSNKLICAQSKNKLNLSQSCPTVSSENYAFCSSKKILVFKNTSEFNLSCLKEPARSLQFPQLQTIKNHSEDIKQFLPHRQVESYKEENMNTKEESQSKAAKQFESSTLENISKQIPPFELDQNASSNILGGAPDTLESFIPIQRITSVAYPQVTVLMNNCRRFSSPTSPSQSFHETKPNIPQVVITNHDYDETDEEMSPRCRKLSRSLSSPDGLRVSSKMRNQIGQDSSIGFCGFGGVSGGVGLGPLGTYVTLDDVAPYKLRRYRTISTGSSAFSAGDERIFLSEDAWSYTNCSSSITGDTRTDTEADSEQEDKIQEHRLTRDFLDMLVLRAGVQGTRNLAEHSDGISDRSGTGTSEISCTEASERSCTESTGDPCEKSGLEADESLRKLSSLEPEESIRKLSALQPEESMRKLSALDAEESMRKLSIIEDTEEDLPNKPKTKSSRWKKLSNMVKWTPFIQTYRKRKYPWVQLAGHSGSFIRGSQGTVLKKCGEQEEQCYRLLMEDSLSPVVPTYYRSVMKDGRKYLELSCCLSEFNSPCIMDIKMGVRTFLSGETTKLGANVTPLNYCLGLFRKDLYEKMVGEDPSAPTPVEQIEGAISKYRYLDWRDCISSSREYGFRVEATTLNGKSSKDFKSIRTESQIEAILCQFAGNKTTIEKYLERLLTIKSLCLRSSFFNSHELIGSSLLLIHDGDNASIWMIDFEKSTPMPPDVPILHTVPWEENTREDGYLIGLESLINIFSNLLENSD
ncbi:uncharacterized protein LOC111701723 [Eurytemora carolleeae]|uniref:uncharacterized protein LOC111701723 n=1 Tax=Eurytemora carolleeae TaxID=1294199 RepID=UPI000C78E463|nr:uncharacterized protein LOC111701723 [Eurytemora carolleeae]|eukprot:XP_023328902.1 uncharacterized protein LOC111701723 [Eurytemora affinis]